MKKHLITLSIILSLNSFANDVRFIESLEKPDAMMQDSPFLLENKKGSGMNSILKAFLNQPKKMAMLLDQTNIENLSNVLTRELESYSNPTKTLTEWTTLFCKTILHLSSVPNPNPSFVKARSELPKLYSRFFSKMSSKTKMEFLGQVSNLKYSPLALFSLFSQSNSDLCLFYQHMIENNSNEDKALLFQKATHFLSSQELLSLFQVISNEDQLHLLEVTGNESLSSHKAYTSFKTLASNSDKELAKTYFISIKDLPSTTQASLLSAFNHSDQFYNSSEIMPGRLGNQNILHTRFGNCDAYFYMNVEKYGDMLKTIDKINLETIIAVDQLSPRSSVRGYVTSNKKYPDPIGVNNDGEECYYDSFGRVFEEELSQNNRNILNDLFGFQTINNKLDIHLKLNHDGEKWRPLFSPISLDNLPLDLSDPQNFRLVDYSAFDWQLSPGVLTGLLLQDQADGDRFLIYLTPKDFFSVCFVEPLKKNSTLFPYLIEAGAIDHKSSFTPGSTKGKSLNLCFESIASKNQDHHIDFLEAKKNDFQRTDNGKTYKNGLKFIRYENNTTNMLSKEKYHSSNDGVDIFEIEKEDYVHQFSNQKKIPFNAQSIRKVYRLVKYSQGFSHISDLKLSTEDLDEIYIINQTSLKGNYQHFPIAEDQTPLGMPWIQLYRFQNDQCLKTNKKLFDSLLLTPIEEIFFRDEVEDCNHFDHHKYLERFETTLDVILISK